MWCARLREYAISRFSAHTCELVQRIRCSICNCLYMCISNLSSSPPFATKPHQSCSFTHTMSISQACRRCFVLDVRSSSDSEPDCQAMFVQNALDAILSFVRLQQFCQQPNQHVAVLAMTNHRCD